MGLYYEPVSSMWFDAYRDTWHHLDDLTFIWDLPYSDESWYGAEQYATVYDIGQTYEILCGVDDENIVKINDFPFSEVNHDKGKENSTFNREVYGCSCVNSLNSIWRPITCCPDRLSFSRDTEVVLFVLTFDAFPGPGVPLAGVQGVDRSRLIEGIARAEYYLPQNYMLPGWDNVQILLDEAIHVRDNPYSRQIHVNPASSRLRRAMQDLGVGGPSILRLKEIT